MAHVRVPFGQPALHQVEIADDDRQHVVEVVGDAAGQLADGVHFLHLQQLAFGLDATGGLLAQIFVGPAKVGIGLAKGAVGARGVAHPHQAEDQGRQARQDREGQQGDARAFRQVRALGQQVVLPLAHQGHQIAEVLHRRQGGLLGQNGQGGLVVTLGLGLDRNQQLLQAHLANLTDVLHGFDLGGIVGDQGAQAGQSPVQRLDRISRCAAKGRLAGEQIAPHAGLGGVEDDLNIADRPLHLLGVFDQTHPFGVVVDQPRGGDGEENQECAGDQRKQGYTSDARFRPFGRHREHLPRYSRQSLLRGWRVTQA